MFVVVGFLGHLQDKKRNQRVCGIYLFLVGDTDFCKLDLILIGDNNFTFADQGIDRSFICKSREFSTDKINNIFWKSIVHKFRHSRDRYSHKMK